MRIACIELQNSYARPLDVIFCLISVWLDLIKYMPRLILICKDILCGGKCNN